jgi:dienelactone hydrolase
MDPRWQNLPHTDTEFVPTAYPDREAWEAERARLRQQILFAAGLWPMPEKPPLNARIWNRIERDGYTVEKVWFQSLPGFYVGGSLYRPIDPKPKSHPGVLSPHGHARLGRLSESETASYQARGLTLARIGCTAFMWDMIDYNDSARHLSGDYEDETYAVVHRAPWAHEQDDRMLWNLNALGFQLWNSIRALDFIAQLPEVDPNRLACTGESGGGTQTYNLYAVDDRLHAAAPVCMVSAYMQGGCVCENAPLLRIDTNNVDIGATIAPKPLLLVSSTQDWTRHTPQVEYPAIAKIYDLYGAADHVAQVQIDAPHGYNKAMREAVYRWLATWFDLPIGQDYTEPPYETEPCGNLLAFIDGLPDGAITNHQQLFQQCIEAAGKALETYRPESLDRLDENRRVLGQALRIAVGYDDSGVTLQRKTETQFAGLACRDGVLIGDRRGVRVPFRSFTPDTPAGVSILLIHPQGINALYSPMVRDLLARGHAVFAIDPFGVGQNVGEQNPEQPRGSTKFFTTFNRTDDAERIYDIVLALRYILSTGPQAVNVVGFDDAGLWTLVAGAVLEPRDTTCRFAIDTAGLNTADHRDYLCRLPIPGILKAGGLPNAAALVAPHDLLLHNTGGVFDSTWAGVAYALYPGAALTVRKDRLPNDALIAFLDGSVLPGAGPMEG